MTMTSGEFAHALFPDVKAKESPGPFRHRAEWYCSNEECSIRHVTIEAKYPHGDGPTKPPAMRCPSCGEPLEFHHFLKSLTLVPATKS